MSKCARMLAVVTPATLRCSGADFRIWPLGRPRTCPYVPTPSNVVDAMLDIAKVGPGDFVIDLGSGDGRIVITAAKKYGARGFGVDLDGSLVSGARREAERQGVKDKVEFHARNLFITEIGQATVLTMYLFPRVNMQLRPRIFAELKPGTRVVSHEFDFGNWKPDAQKTIAVPNKSYGPPSSVVYLWIVPANAAGRWQWKLAHDGASWITISCSSRRSRSCGVRSGSRSRRRVWRARPCGATRSRSS